MSFGREKRRLLGWLALLAPIPLPFNELLSWPILGLYAAMIALFLYRSRQGTEQWLPTWALNVLGLAYFPVLGFDFVSNVSQEGQVIRPLIHLGLFTVLAKLYSLRRDKDAWQVFLGISFLALAAIGTSVHPSIVLYLLALLVLMIVVLIRFAFFQVLAAFGHTDHPSAIAPIRGFVAVATVATIACSVPLFALLPRVQSPFIMGRGSGTGTVVHASGFSDEMSLDVIGRIRSSREVALRARFESGRPNESLLRFKGATYDRYEERRWKRVSPDYPVRMQRDGGFRLAEGAVVDTAEIFLQPLGSVAIPLPLEAVRLEIQTSSVRMDEGRAVSFPIRAPGGSRYEVGLAAKPVISQRAPRSEGDPSLDLTGLSPEVLSLAAEVAGSGSPRERANRIEGHLLTGYEYTLDFVGRGGADPLHDFLFENRAGHCEYFASAMVLMLRAQGIPARLVTGFLGGEYNPLEDYVIVRQRNAHAWVEGWIEGEGWKTFDPTPPSGRPGAEPPGFGLLAQQVWDYLVFRWDRYVLTFGVEDQVRFYQRMRALWRQFLGLFEEDEPGSSSAPDSPPSETVVPAAGVESGPIWVRWTTGGVLLLLIGVGLFWWRRRAPWTATRAYERLRLRLQGAGMAIDASEPPLHLWKRATLRFPTAARSTDRILRLYLEESFGGRVLGEQERIDVKEACNEASRSIRKAG